MPIDKIREILGISQTPSALVRLRPDLLTAVEEIATQDGRTVVDVANELISHALCDLEQAASSLKTWEQLTLRERELTALIWLGLSNPQISQRLSISQNTVKTHIRNILTKFNVNSKEALREKLLGLDLSDWTDMPPSSAYPPTTTD